MDHEHQGAQRAYDDTTSAGPSSKGKRRIITTRGTAQGREAVQASSAPPRPAGGGSFSNPSLVSKGTPVAEPNIALAVERRSSCECGAVYHASDRETGEVVREVRHLCGNGSCPVCGPLLLRRHLAWTCDVFEGHEGLWALHLTLDPRTAGRLDGPLDEMRFAGWLFGEKLRGKLDYRCERAGSKYRFLRSIEWQETDRAHIHALIECALPEDEIRALAYEAGFGASAVVTAVAPTRDAIASAAKYVLKTAYSPGRPYGVQVIASSKGVGYHSQERKEASRAAVVAKYGADVFERTEYEAAVEQKARPTRRLTPTKEEKGRYKALLSGADTRQASCVERVKGTPYGVLRTHRPDGVYRLDVVREVRVGDHVERVVVEGDVGSEAAARAAILTLVGGAAVLPRRRETEAATIPTPRAAR